MSDPNFGVYRMEVSKGGNIAFAVLFILLLVVHLFQSVKYKQCWFGLFIGTALEIIGYCSRASAKCDAENLDNYVTQQMSLTLAPAFIMASYYYLLADIATIYGSVATMLRPSRYNEVLLSSNVGVLVLLFQAVAYRLEPGAQDDPSTLNMNHIMIICGLGFQAATMTVFLFFWVLLFYKVYYHTDRAVPLLARSTKRNLLDTQYKDHIFNPEYAHVRETPKFLYFPFVVFVGTLAIYVRCIFTMVELLWELNDYLMVQERYSFLFDGLMMVLACLLMVIYYPGWVYGKGNKIKVPKSLRAQKQQQQMEQAAYDDQKSPHDRQNTAYDDKESSLMSHVTACLIACVYFPACIACGFLPPAYFWFFVSCSLLVCFFLFTFSSERG